MLAVALILFFFVMPLVLTIATAYVIGRLGAVVVSAAFVLTPLGYLFMGLPLIIGFFLGAGWSAIRR